MTNKMNPGYKSLVTTLLKQALRPFRIALFAFVCAIATILLPLITRAQQNALTCSMTNVPMTNNPGSGTDNSVLNGFTVSASNTGGASWGAVINTPANVVDNNLTNYASGTTVVLGSLTLDVRDNAGNQYSAGNFVGFNINTVLGLSVLGDITISTLDASGNPIENRNGASLLSLDLGGGASDIGFYTNQNFYGVRLSIAAVINVGIYNVYYAFVRGTGSCISPALTCNTPTMLSFPDHPVVAENSTAAVLALGGVTNLGNMVDNDPASAATMVPVAGALGSHGVSVKNTTGQYAAGTYVAFDIENASLLSADLLGDYSIELYDDDVLVQTISGTSFLAGVGLVNSTRQMFGGVSATAFDEARLVFNSTGLADVNLGLTNIYGVYVTNTCGTTLTCDETYPFTNPELSVVINNQRTGNTGVAAVNGEVLGAGNVIDALPDNYATLEADASVLNEVSLSVWDVKNTYPAGTYVGFNIAKTTAGGLIDFVADANILGTITIRTYNDGVPAETKTISDGLLNLDLVSGLVNLSTGTEHTLIGFQATLPFDEAVIAVSGLAGIAEALYVYGAFAVTTSIPGVCTTALPVDFGSISSIFKDGALLVNWTTLSETNNKEFFIEGSKDGKNWVVIGTVPSKAVNGNSDVALEYSFTKSLSGLALSGLSIIALLGMPFFRSRFSKVCLMGAFLVLFGLSCNKDNDQLNVDDIENLYIRIGQRDKDGTVKYSKIVKTINRQ